MNCGSNSGVESQPSKLLVAGSNPVSRSNSERETRRLSLQEYGANDARDSNPKGAPLGIKAESEGVYPLGTEARIPSPAPGRSGETGSLPAAPRPFECEWMKRDHAHVAQAVEHVLGKDGVTSSTLVVGSSSWSGRADFEK